MSQAGPVSRASVSLLGSRLVCQMQQKSTSRLHDNRAGPVSRDPGIAVPGSRLTGLRFFHVIAFAGPAWLIKPARIQWVMLCSCAMVSISCKHGGGHKVQVDNWNGGRPSSHA